MNRIVITSENNGPITGVLFQQEIKGAQLGLSS